MSSRRVLIDIEFAVDEDQFKLAQLREDASGVSDVTDPGIRDAVSRALVRTDWGEHGLAPVRSIVISRLVSGDGFYGGATFAPDPGVIRP